MRVIIKHVIYTFCYNNLIVRGEMLVETRELLIDSFKQLMLEHPFNKITIKMITSKAGVIRPTFYNHFQDKYDIFSAILDEELFDSLYDLIAIDMLQEASKMIFTYFDKNRTFYEHAFDITGQNSFKEILLAKMKNIFVEATRDKQWHTTEVVPILTKDSLAEYYAYNIVLFIEMWLKTDVHHEVDGDEIFKAYRFIVTHDIDDYFQS